MPKRVHETGCIERYADEMNEIAAMDARLDHLCDGAVWAEGPVWFAGPEDAPGEDYVLFSDVKTNRLLRYSRSRGLEVARPYSNYSNGNYRDRRGRLVTCEHGRRCVSRTLDSGEVEILVDRFEDKRLNSPNDLVVKSDGGIWFTDPPYGIIGNDEGYRAESQIIGCYVYCYHEESGKLEIATLDVQRPNGLAFSPDERYLYVADMSRAEFPRSGYRHLLRFTVEGSRLADKRIFAEITPGIPDGFRVDYRGSIFCSCEDGILILSPGDGDNGRGRSIGKIRVPERVSNCTFGGLDQDYLYITASTSLYGIRLRTRGVQYSHLL